MKIKHKLFAIILCVTAVTLLANLLMSRWSFEQSFRQFVNGMEAQRLAPLNAALVESFLENDRSWVEVKDKGFVSLLNGGSLLPNSQEIRAPHSESLFPPPHHRGHPDHRPPPRHKRGTHPGAPSPSSIHKQQFMDGPPTALFDAQGRWVSGARDNKLKERAPSIVPVYDGNELIGELRSSPRVDSPTPLLAQFSLQQLKGSVFVGLFCLVAATVLAWWAAKKFTSPLEKIRQGVSKLASGSYDLSFDEQRSDEIGSVMENLEYLAEALEKNRSSKQRFFADISHELRTPLTILSGEIEVLKAGIRQFDDKQLSSFEYEVTRLRHLVEDLHQLSVSDIGGLKYHFQRTNVSDCLVKVLDRLRLKADEKGLKLMHQISPAVYSNADEKRLIQLFLNICENSIHYTDAPGEIRFELDVDQENIVIVVNDTAPTVPDSECELLMEALYRQDKSRTRREAGSGLGLAICKNIVEAHHGSISITPSSMGGIRTMIKLNKMA